MNGNAAKNGLKRVLVGGGIVAYVIMAFEVAIMISPFAFFFYSVFNPIFHFLGGFAATRWLTAFFLPHMIVPPSAFLRFVRVAGSVLFVLGAVTFIVCALQIYAGKILRWRIATRGLYRVIRHPQYVALVTWGVGMAILWPRFLVLVTLSVMAVLYYFLAKDEERRMTGAYGDEYREYAGRTGMFLPLRIERVFGSIAGGRIARAYAPAIVPVAALGLALLVGFGLRAMTVAELPVQLAGNVGVVTILPADNEFAAATASRLAGLQQPDGGSSLLSNDQAYLAYLMPVDYVMQGMIANTGQQWQLYKRGHTVQMIADWVLHPFRHLQQCPMHIQPAACPHHNPQMARRMMCPLGINDPAFECGKCPYRRVVLVRVDAGRGRSASKRQLLSASAARTPVGFIDIDVRSGRVLQASAVHAKTAWADVPTPIF